MIITCAIIDDEPLAAGLLESYAKKTPYLNLVGTYNSAVQAMKDLRENPVQLLFLDIQMPELSGIEFAKILPRETRIIFTTAFPQYAIEGFRVNALDYLLKPISYNDFLKATDKALEWFNVAQRQDVYRRDRFMFVKSDYKLQRVCLDDILYIEGLTQIGFDGVSEDGVASRIVEDNDIVLFHLTKAFHTTVVPLGPLDV